VTWHRHSRFLASAPSPKQDVARLRPRIFDRWVEAKRRRQPWFNAVGNLGVAAPEPSVVDLPYFHGRGGGSYRFGYAWVNQPG
jgi:hypothetical protein